MKYDFSQWNDSFIESFPDFGPMNFFLPKSKRFLETNHNSWSKQFCFLSRYYPSTYLSTYVRYMTIHTFIQTLFQNLFHLSTICYKYVLFSEIVSYSFLISVSDYSNYSFWEKNLNLYQIKIVKSHVDVKKENQMRLQKSFFWTIPMRRIHTSRSTPYSWFRFGSIDSCNPPSSSASSWIWAMTGLRLVVRKKHPSEHLLTHSRAHGFFSNSTMASPVDRPRASTPTTHRSISPKIENALWSNSLDTHGPNLWNFFVKINSWFMNLKIYII